MCRTDALLLDLAAAARAARFGKRRLAREACDPPLHPNTLRGFGSPGWNPSLNTLRRLERAVARLPFLPPGRSRTRAGRAGCKP